MARRPSSQSPPHSANLSTEEAKRGIVKLQRRIVELQAFNPASLQKRWSAEVTALGASIEDTLVSVYGFGTIEYHRYESASRLDNGPVTLQMGPSFGGARSDQHEAQQYVAEGIQRAVVLLQQAVRGLEEEISDRTEWTSGADVTPLEVPRDLSKVFIVHGHDGEARSSVEQFIKQLGFEAIVLHRRPNKGRTIITKFREEAAGVGFAVVLMTPDDVGSAADQSADQLRCRARQNVVFEFGFFIGELGPENVVALVKGEIERPSDLDGVVYISLDNGSWEAALGRELETAGYAIDWNKAMRS